jgi:hypothetical protein
MGDESPFIRPSSPASRSQLSPPKFQGNTSAGVLPILINPLSNMALVQMRAGTQTLIQALQALPLVDDPEIDDELTSHDMSTAESDSDDEGRHGELLLYFRTFAICNAIQQ